MEDEIFSADDFFGDIERRERTSFRHVTGRKSARKGEDVFEDIKVRMVMKLENCSRETAVRLIEERSAELRAKENARRNARDLDFTK